MQNWTLYNKSQTKEKMFFLKILNDAVDALQIEYDYKGNGRPHFPLDDMIKIITIKVFNNFSSRRTMAELQLAYALGYIRQVPHFNSINNYMEKEEVTPYLQKLYQLLALPLVNIEETFLIDATGFSLPHKTKWATIRLAMPSEVRDYKKLHIVSGYLTNIICQAKVTRGSANDNPEFQFLVKETAKKFRMKEVCADAGYLSRKNAQAVEDLGAVPYIMPKVWSRPLSLGYPAYRRMIRLWKENEQAFKEIYHKRSCVESTFSSLKRKFGGFVRSKTDTAQANELLCKVACHNAAVLASSVFSLGVELNFN